MPGTVDFFGYFWNMISAHFFKVMKYRYFTVIAKIDGEYYIYQPESGHENGDHQPHINILDDHS